MKKTKAQRKARNQKIKKFVIQVFAQLAEGLVKVWHKNHSFIINAEDAKVLTLETLNELVRSREEEK